jgi:FAD/FMN-containing dehydrogenase
LVEKLAGFAGDQFAADDAGYDDARKLYNGLIDKRPALIARCAGTTDIAAAIGAARERSLELSVRGGGHNVAGRALVEGGLVVDLSGMKAIEVDAGARRVHAGGGVNWGELNKATQAHGLAVTGGVISTTGIAGLTLGGGIGWLMPKYGLALDNLVSAEVVTADGRVLTASEDENADLFWALRGGGGNFGAVSTFEFQLHEVGPTITGGRIVYPLSAAGELLRFFREWAPALPDEAMAAFALLRAPDDAGTNLAGVVVCHIGSPDQAERDLAPLLGHGSPVLTEIGPLPYSVQNTLIDEGFPHGSLNYWRSRFLDDFPDGAVDALVEAFGRAEAPLAKIILESVHGQVCRIPVDATACELRRPGFNCVITNVWLDPGTTEANIAWTREAFEALSPFGSSLRYVNYLSADELGDAELSSVYGANLDRLRQVKRMYDPDNIFRQNLNIPPA